VRVKVKIKGFDDKDYYFNSIDEVPEEFEPKTYKALMVGTQALLIKQQDDARKATDAELQAEQAESQQRAQAMQESWETDAAALSKAGLFPKDPAKLETAKEEVLSYIEAEMNKGNVITSFNQAYKSMMYDKQPSGRC
jgi:type II secretory pathway pseudopilin PulG